MFFSGGHTKVIIGNSMEQVEVLSKATKSLPEFRRFSASNLQTKRCVFFENFGVFSAHLDGFRQ